MPADRFSSLAALKEYLGVDGFRIRCLNRNSKVTIISPHGGFIEDGTSSIARAIAGRNHSFFDFQGLLDANIHDTHVTSVRFRDPDLSQLLNNSITAVSIHGMHSQGHKTIYLGGRNLELKEIIHKRLLAAGFDVNPDPPKWRGEHPRNIVNMVAQGGVQLELSNELRADLFAGKPFYRCGRSSRQLAPFHNLVRAVRTGIDQYMHLAEANR